MTTHPQRILLANALAADYFRDCLHSSIGDGPRGYLQGRGVSGRALRGRDWEIGYAPPGWTGLVARLRSGPWPFTDQELLDSGLALATRRGTLIDRFRDRVMFGVLHGIDSRMVGFIGRCAPHSGDDTPKYLNSPNGPVYNKNHHLFGLAEQRSVLQDGARPLLVEGPLDVLSASGLGLEVAPVSACGTALSVRQANQLEPFLRGGGLVAYDGDEAGGRAALNAYERLSTYTDEIRGVQLPSGEDPASLAVSAPHILAGLLQTAPPLAALLVTRRSLPSSTGWRTRRSGSARSMRPPGCSPACNPPRRPTRSRGSATASVSARERSAGTSCKRSPRRRLHPQPAANTDLSTASPPVATPTGRCGSDAKG